MRLSKSGFSGLLLAATLCFAQPNNKGYYRSPTIYGNTVVFTSEGDLWEAPVTGGMAQRLTSHPGEESNAAFSPDGKTIAFSADYEGPTEVYSMPAEGGLPERRTYDGGAAVVGWTPDGRILYQTHRYSTLPDAQLVTIDAESRAEAIPLSQAAQGSFTPDGKTLFFTRFPFQGSYAKRYQGGTAETLWKYTAGQEAVPLTGDYKGTSKNAMYWKGRVYFLSDRDGTMNLWSMDENGKRLQQHTHQQGWDIRTAALSQGRIVFQMGADLRLYDIASGTENAIPIELPSDFDHLREHWVKEPADYVTAAHLSPDGNSIVLTARGRVFVSPVKQGRFVDASVHKPGRFREARMMPDGKTLLMLSTESGEVELWTYAANGTGDPKQLTTDGNVLRWEAVPSPDGKWIAHQDKNNQLYLLEIATKKQSLAGTAQPSSNSGPAYSDIRWSPDSRWILYSRDAANGFSQLMLYSVEARKETALTTDRYNSGPAAWSPDGKWIYFFSDRSFSSAVGSPWGSRQPDPYFDRTNKLYEMALKKGQVSPYEPADELHPAKPEEAKPEGKEAAGPDAAVTAAGPKIPKVEIDLDGIIARIQEVPVEPGNYSSLVDAGKRLCWIDYDPQKSEKNQLECLDVANKGDKPESMMEGVEQLEISADGKKLMVRRKKDFFVVDSSLHEAAMKTPKTLDDSKVDLSKWTFSVIPQEEYREAFYDAWRLHRDYFYDRHMHGVEWKTMRDKCGEILNRVRDREELSDLLSGMVSELSALHTFVFGGDIRHGNDKIELASLGAVLEPDPQGAGYVVKHIYQADPDHPEKLSPLAKQGVDIAEGDTVVAINGRELGTGTQPGDVLRDQAGKQVLLRVRPRAPANNKTTTRDVVVKPITLAQERDLRYGEWELTRRRMTEQSSGGTIGYVHLRAMGRGDINRWEEEFTPIYDRAGMVIDVRHNQGGNIDSWILGKLLRKAWMYWQPRTGVPSWNMQEAFRGHLVLLCDQWTASDGEAFSAGFHELGLGKTMGTRTWGGEIWLTGSNVLADNGVATAAELGVYTGKREWLIEGRGFEPDIVVDNLPHATFEGKDAQLEAALAHLKHLIEVDPRPVPKPPDYPDKSWHATTTK
jgi:tricorn protease